MSVEPELREPAGIRCEHAVDRGDVLRLVRLGIPRAEVAALCGFGLAMPIEERETGRPASSSAKALAPEPPTAAPAADRPHLAPPLWRAIGPDLREPDPAERRLPFCLENRPGKTAEELAARSHAIVPAAPLAPVARLGAVLRCLLTVNLPTAGLDEPRLVRRLADLRPITRLPRRARRSWTPRLQVYWDQAQALGPCLDDQMTVLSWLRRWRGEAGLECIVVRDSGQAQWYPNRRRGQRSPEPKDVCSPDSGTTLLALSDLGFGRADLDRQERWTRIRRHATRGGARCSALVLCPRRRWQHSLARPWNAVEWERSHEVKPEETARALEEVFLLLSPAIRIEPGLLRAVRRLVAGGAADLGVEIDAWMDPRVIWRAAPLAMVLDPAQAQALQPRFRELPAERRRPVVDLLKRFHGHLAPNILEEELFHGGERDGETLESFAQQAAGLLARNCHDGDLREGEAAYLQRLERRLSPEAWQQDEFAALWALAHRTSGGFSQPLPDGLELRQVLWALEDIREPRWYTIRQLANGLVVRDGLPDSAPAGVGSPLASFRARLPRFEVRWRGANGRWDRHEISGLASMGFSLIPEEAAALDIEVRGDLGDARLVMTPHPPWAERFWRDSRGLWVATKGQWLRWTRTQHLGVPKTEIRIEEEEVPVELIWPTWARELGQDDHGVFAVLELAGDVVTKLRWIPAGWFLMGSPEDEAGRYDDEGPQHWVRLSQGFWLADAPCTQAEWRAVMGTDPSSFKGDNLPVEQVSWEDCQEFCEKLRARFPGLDARLPTEAEWEYACRAGTASAFNDGSACTDPEGPDPALLKLGWFDKNSGGKTHPVREKKAPNRWGLHDMHGNVWEWCADWKGDYVPDEQVDPTGAASGHVRVIRGGSWSSRALRCRSACRGWGHPAGRNVLLGFRLASGQSGQDQQASQERAAGERAGRGPAADGGERRPKKERK